MRREPLTRTPEAPHGVKKDGTPMKKRGRLVGKWKKDGTPNKDYVRRRASGERIPLARMRLPERVNALLEDVEEIFHRHDGIDDVLALKAIDRLTRLSEITGNLQGLLGHQTTTVNVLVGSEQAMRTLGAANELQLAEELETRAKALRAKWAEKKALALPAPAPADTTEAEYEDIGPREDVEPAEDEDVSGTADGNTEQDEDIEPEQDEDGNTEQDEDE
jgi:hypothetical protein